MSNKKKSLDFHQTFKPELTCLNSLMLDLNNCSNLSYQEISKVTGIPTGSSSGKVVPTICYLEYMGLIDYELNNKNYIFDYTALGECVVNEDPGLTEKLTLLIMHCMLTRKLYGAELWSFIVNLVFPKYNGTISKSNFDKEIEMHFGKQVNISPFSGSYNGLFKALNLIEIDNNGYHFNPHLYNDEYIFLYGYILYTFWNEWVYSFGTDELNQNKISLNEITALQLDEIGFRNVFGWSKDEEYRTLESLNDRGIIALNRQMSPFTVRRVFTENELLELLYSELC